MTARTKTTRRRRPASVALMILPAALLCGCSDLPPADEMFDLSARGEGTGVQFVGLVKAVKVVATYRATERQRAEALARGRQIQAQRQARIDARALQASKSYAAKAKSQAESAGKYSAEAARMEAKAKQLAAAAKADRAARAEAEAARNQAAAARGKAEAADRAAKAAEKSAAGAAEKVKKQEAKKEARFIAIPTAPAPGTPEAKKGSNYVLFDTETREVVENKVYVIDEAPKEKLAKFDTYTAQVVGAGR